MSQVNQYQKINSFFLILIIAVYFLYPKEKSIIIPKNVDNIKEILLTPNDFLVAEGKRLGVLSLNGKQNPILQRAAEEHANFQAEHMRQGHQLWEYRMPKLQKQLPGYSFSEVANESWPGQSTEDAAVEMYRSWRQSPGHWSAVNGKCKLWGYAMALGKNGTWYACGIFAK